MSSPSARSSAPAVCALPAVSSDSASLVGFAGLGVSAGLAGCSHPAVNSGPAAGLGRRGCLCCTFPFGGLGTAGARD